MPADDLTDPAPATTFAHLDATTVLSRAIAELGIYPAVDPLDSTSRIMDPNIVGSEHYDVARGVQKILQVSVCSSVSGRSLRAAYSLGLPVICAICLGGREVESGLVLLMRSQFQCTSPLESSFSNALDEDSEEADKILARAYLELF